MILSLKETAKTTALQKLKLGCILLSTHGTTVPHLMVLTKSKDLPILVLIFKGPARTAGLLKL